ncbi:hypothetical protein SAMN05660653_01403 [Desulfonatronum thiosulfatophilum]|uniref:Uncharacterized protein n=1 Tax=Desulfonatronum thiosulfatophilum TaxID=617002 RepID=A0A1G6C8V9_9BACT|nr:hypothetical protein SAMN05660653_01403 [Desulfonatronum thiosulfatophilum]
MSRLFKNPDGKAQKKFKPEAYLVIREGLNFLQQRSQRGFFNSLLYPFTTTSAVRMASPWRS